MADEKKNTSKGTSMDGYRRTRGRMDGPHMCCCPTKFIAGTLWAVLQPQAKDEAEAVKLAQGFEPRQPVDGPIMEEWLVCLSLGAGKSRDVAPGDASQDP